MAHTLEVTDEEKLVVNLRELDCVTFVETVIALTNMIRSGSMTSMCSPASWSVFATVMGIGWLLYRLHYIRLHTIMSKTACCEIFPVILAVPVKVKIHFMTFHRMHTDN